MLNHLIRGLLFHYKKVIFCFNFIWKGCFKKMHHLFFRVRANDVNSTKSQPKIFIWWINKVTSDKRWQAKFSGIVLRWKQFLSFKNCSSVSICSVLNRSNRDTTVYYRLIFCAFSWPNMVKWRNSGIIITSKTLYSDPRVYLCKKGDDNRPNISKIRRFAKPKLAIFGNFAKGLIMQIK